MITTLTRTLNPPGSICGRTRVQQPSNPVILINARAEQMILYRQYTRNKSSVIYAFTEPDYSVSKFWRCKHIILTYIICCLIVKWITCPVTPQAADSTRIKIVAVYVHLMPLCCQVNLVTCCNMGLKRLRTLFSCNSYSYTVNSKLLIANVYNFPNL